MVNIPPLRERPDDIQPLVTLFLNMFTSKYRKHMNLTPGLMEALRQYSWPGNVRERQILMHSIVITKDHGPLSVKDLPRHMTGNENEELFFPDDGITYDILYDILIKQNGDIHSDWDGTPLDVDAYEKVVCEPYDLRWLARLAKATGAAEQSAALF